MKPTNPTTLLTFYQGMTEKDQKAFREYLAAYEKGVELGKQQRMKKKTRKK